MGGDGLTPSLMAHKAGVSADRDAFDVPGGGSGAAEWAQTRVNITRGCRNDCLYCYAASNAQRFKLKPRNDWGCEVLTDKANMSRFPKRNGVVMFPSAHDITPGNIEASIRIARLIVRAGNRLLIVSKPHLECIRRLIEALAEDKERVLFRFTINTTDEKVARFWDPGAPSPAERLAALREAFAAGYQTSVAAEPLLGGCEVAMTLLAAVHPFVTHSIWIGKLNQARRRVDMSSPDNAAAVAALEALQGDEDILRLYETLRQSPFLPLVRWKDSMAKVIGRRTGAVAEHHGRSAQTGKSSPEAQPGTKRMR